MKATEQNFTRQKFWLFRLPVRSRVELLLTLLLVILHVAGMLGWKPGREDDVVLIYGLCACLWICYFILQMVLPEIGKPSQVSSVEQSKEQPWLNYKIWKDKRIYSYMKGSIHIPYTGVNLTSIMITLPPFLVIDSSDDGNLIRIIISVLVFPLFALILLYIGPKRILRYLNYGDAVLEMNPFPGVINGKVSGRILFNNTNSLNTSYEITVIVQKKINSRYSSYLLNLWTDTGIAKVLPDEKCIEFSFDVPEYFPESHELVTAMLSDTVSRPGKAIWTLLIKRQDNGYKQVFEIPVYKTDRTTDFIPREFTRLEIDPDTKVSFDKFVKWDTFNGLFRIQHGLSRLRINSAIWFAFSIFLGLIEGFLLYFETWDDDLILFTQILGIPALLLFVSSGYFLFHKYQVSISKDLITVKKTLLGIPLSAYSAPWSTLRIRKYDETWLMYGDGKTMDYMVTVEALSDNGKVITVIEKLSRRHVAKYAINLIHDSLELKRPDEVEYIDSKNPDLSI